MCVSDNQGSNGSLFKYNDTYACTAEFFCLHGGFKILTKQIILLDIIYYAIRNATFSPQPFSVSCDFFPATQTPLYNFLSFRLASLFFFLLCGNCSLPLIIFVNFLVPFLILLDPF